MRSAVSRAAVELVAARLGPGVGAWFTTRRGGVSAPPWGGLNLSLGVGDDPASVATNREAVRRATGVRAIVWGRPVHGADVARVGEDGVARALLEPEVTWRQGVDPDLDGLVTTAPGRGLAALAADCVPVLLAAYDGERACGVAAVHSGRRGVAAGAVPNAVAALREVSGASRVRAVVGPAIGGSCYEVGAQVREEVAAREPAAWASTSWGTASLDLPAAVVNQLTRAEVSVEEVFPCTHCAPWAYSHRRDRLTGRFAGVVVLRHAGAPAL